MFKYTISLLLVFLTAFFGCSKEAQVTYASQHLVPGCIKEKIHDIASGDVWNPPARIYAYSYKGQTVYYFPQRCCDIPSILYNKHCNIICSPDGGLTGKGDGSCHDFFSVRTEGNLVWADER